MAVVDQIEKVSFRLLKKNVPPSRSLYKILNRNTITSSYSTIPYVESLLNEGNIKKLRNDQLIDPHQIQFFK